MSTTTTTPVSSIPWQDEILVRLQERDSNEKAWSPIIEQYTKLSNQSLIYRDRNRSLLKAATSAKNGTTTSGGASSNNDDAAVRTAYISSLESQLSTTREELAAAYKVHSQNAQRLIALTDIIREKEEKEKEEENEKRVLRAELERLGRKAEEARELKKDQERNIQSLQDELTTLTLEYNQLEQRNEDLKHDNASLLKRWLEQKNSEVTKMNNDFETESNRIKKQQGGKLSDNNSTNPNSPTSTSGADNTTTTTTSTTTATTAATNTTNNGTTSNS